MPGSGVIATSRPAFTAHFPTGWARSTNTLTSRISCTLSARTRCQPTTFLPPERHLSNAGDSAADAVAGVEPAQDLRATRGYGDGVAKRLGQVFGGANQYGV